MGCLLRTSVYNLVEYSKNYRKTTGSLWNYYRDEPNSGAEGNIDYSIKDSKPFDYKISITGKLENNDVEKENIKNVVPLKYLSNFFRSLNIPLINCEVSLNLTWSKNCVLTSKAKREDDPDADPGVIGINNPTYAVFEITDCKFYVSVVTLSAENDNKLLEQLKTGFKRTIKWNKYRSKISNQTADNNLNYLVDPTFTNVNRLFLLAFENETDRTSFSNYCVPKVEIKAYNDGKPFFEIPVKNKEEAYEQITEMSKNNDYTTGNLLDCEYFKEHYQLIAIDLSKQTELENCDLKQHTNFIGRLDNDKTMFFIIENKEEITLKIPERVVPLKYLSNFFRSLEMPLINCKIHLELNSNNNCEMHGADTYAGGDSTNNRETTFKITNTKLYVPIVTLSTKANVNKFDKTIQ